MYYPFIDVKLLPFQHDELYLPMNTRDTSTSTPNEAFFIRQFSSQREDEPRLNSTILRQEEKVEFSKRLTNPSQEYFAHVRDFKTICRGEPLVILNQSLLMN